MGFLQAIQLFLGLLPTIIETVKAVETAFPQPGSGAQKLDLVLSTVQAAAATVPEVVAATGETKAAVQAKDVPALTAGLTHVIGAVVSFFNAAGIFKKSA